jgi:putative two-component system response regulator
MDDLLDGREATILVVDDTPENLSLLNALLRERYRVKIATSGERALSIARSAPPDLVLLDVMMPTVDGYETCRRMKADPLLAGIPVIFLTAKSDVEDEKQGFSVGAVDYITKPLSPSILLSRVRTHVTLKLAQERLRESNDWLEQEVQERTRELEATQEASILALATLAETRDNETGNHIRRTARYVRELALKLRELPEYAAVLDNATVATLVRSAPLHDIGKVGIADSILLKPGKLTPEEFEIMKTHAAIGRDALAKAEALLGAETSYLGIAKEIAGGHHEKWDGSGYPDGLSGASIPISARLMALADVYDALISKRVYKEAFPREKAEAIILEGRGRHFDPNVVDAFTALKDDFWEIAQKMSD